MIYVHSLEVSHGFMKSFFVSLSRAPPPSRLLSTFPLPGYPLSCPLAWYLWLYVPLFSVYWVHLHLGLKSGLPRKIGVHTTLLGPLFFWLGRKAPLPRRRSACELLARERREEIKKQCISTHLELYEFHILSLEAEVGGFFWSCLFAPVLTSGFRDAWIPGRRVLGNNGKLTINSKVLFN